MVTLEDIPLDDRKTYELLSSGRSLGVFQLETGWIKGILRDIKPDSISEIAAVTALIRPGSLDMGGPQKYAARKRSGDTQPDVHPDIDDDLEPVLRETYGIIVYQEQVLEIIRVVTGWGYDKADVIFYALRKKNLVALESAKPGFFEASKYSKAVTSKVWDVLVAFGDYGFNKSHSVGYAYITYWTAYLKAHYPIEFISALLTADGDDQEKTKLYIKEAQALNIAVLPPDINKSNLGFTPTSEGIRYGLSAIKGLGEPTVKCILRTRPFNDIDGFLRRADAKLLNSGVLTALVRSGALDSIWRSRKQLLGEADRLVSLVRRHRESEAQAQRTLLKVSYAPKGRADQSGDIDAVERAQGELETLGTRLTFPSLVIKAVAPLSASEMAWLMSVLRSRQPESDVYLEIRGFRSKLPLRSSERGLKSVVQKIGLDVCQL
jgi:DNA polymerase-3 subunit alpha